MKCCGECVFFEDCKEWTTPDEAIPEIVGGCPVYRALSRPTKKRVIDISEPIVITGLDERQAVIKQIRDMFDL